jgi:hypothetical protein
VRSTDSWAPSFASAIDPARRPTESTRRHRWTGSRRAPRSTSSGSARRGGPGTRRRDLAAPPEDARDASRHERHVVQDSGFDGDVVNARCETLTESDERHLRRDLTLLGVAALRPRRSRAARNGDHRFPLRTLGSSHSVTRLGGAQRRPLHSSMGPIPSMSPRARMRSLRSGKSPVLASSPGLPASLRGTGGGVTATPPR